MRIMGRMSKPFFIIIAPILIFIFQMYDISIGRKLSGL